MSTNLFPFTAKNLIVGSALVYIGCTATAVAATVGDNSFTTTTLNPTSDATLFNLGDQISIGSNTETPLIRGINTSTGVLTHDAVTATAVSGDVVTQVWGNLGATDGDILVNFQIDITDQYCDQSIFPITGVRTKGDYSFRFPLADMQMLNNARAMGSPDANVTTAGGYDSLEIGTNENFRTDKYLVTGYGVNGKKRSWFIDVGASKTQAQLKQSKTNKEIMNFDVTAYFNDSTQSLGRVKQGAAWKYA